MDNEPRQTPDWVEDVKSEVTGMAKDGFNHPSTAPVLTGAAIGAAAGWILPFVSLPVGLVAGAGFALYRRIKK
jgi:ABC-type xylose transport system permease subunit